MKRIEGIYPALLTPFDKNGQINDEALSKLVTYNLNQGVNGFYVGGSTAEAFLISIEQRKHILKVVANIAKGKCILIAHVGAIATELSVELAQYAQDLGYDIISSVPPFYYKFNFPEIKKYYYDIVARVDLPMLIYNIPVFTGVNLTSQNFFEFLCDDRFIGIKFTSNDLFLLETIHRTYPNKTIFNGYDEIFLSGLAAGASGAIGSTFNFMADKFIAIYNLWKNGLIEEAQKIQSTVNTIVEALLKVGVIQGEKEILNQLGFDFGEALAPFYPLSEENKRFLQQTVLPLL